MLKLLTRLNKKDYYIRDFMRRKENSWRDAGRPAPSLTKKAEWRKQANTAWNAKQRTS